MATEKRGNVTAEVDAEVHRKLRVAILDGKLPQKTFGEWLRAKEAEQLVKLISNGKAK